MLTTTISHEGEIGARIDVRLEFDGPPEERNTFFRALITATRDHDVEYIFGHRLQDRRFVIVPGVNDHGDEIVPIIRTALSTAWAMNYQIEMQFSV